MWVDPVARLEQEKKDAAALAASPEHKRDLANHMFRVKKAADNVRRNQVLRFAELRRWRKLDPSKTKRVRLKRFAPKQVAARKAAAAKAAAEEQARKEAAEWESGGDSPLMVVAATPAPRAKAAALETPADRQMERFEDAGHERRGVRGHLICARREVLHLLPPGGEAGAGGV